MGRFGENKRWYSVKVTFLTNEDEIRTEEEIGELLRELFETNNYKLWGTKVIDNECSHNEWQRTALHVSDPDAWYYNQPCYEVEYVCAKCGTKKYVKE